MKSESIFNDKSFIQLTEKRSINDAIVALYFS